MSIQTIPDFYPHLYTVFCAEPNPVGKCGALTETGDLLPRWLGVVVT